jgi:hypothetical protein
MGRFIDEILQPGERVLYSTNAHWMFFLPAIAAWIVAIVFLVLSRMVTADALVLICLSLAAIAGLAAVDVDQSILGRVLNYGNVIVRGVGEHEQRIKTIASPLAFRNAITTRPADS